MALRENFEKKEEVPPGGQWIVWSSSPAHWRNDPQELGSGESPDHHLSVIKKCLQNTSGLNSNNIRQSSCFITKSKRSRTRSRYIEPQKPGAQLGSCGTGRRRSRKETLPVGNITITHCMQSQSGQTVMMVQEMRRLGRDKPSRQGKATCDQFPRSAPPPFCLLCPG